MANYKVETGYQLFARLNTRPNLENIYPNIFSNCGPKPNEVIEIVGDTSTGKTFLITEFIAYCILPPELDNIYIGGKYAGAIIINTDHHFTLFKLCEILESILKNCQINFKNNFTSTTIEDIIKFSLKNLIILNCFDSYQLHATILNLENIVSDYNKVSLIVLDSLSAYYWGDRLVGGIKSMDNYQKSVLKLIQLKTKENNITIVFTKYGGFFSKRELVEECALQPTLERINYRILLEKYAEENKFIAHVTFPDNTLMKHNFVINKLIEWID